MSDTFGWGVVIGSIGTMILSSAIFLYCYFKMKNEIQKDRRG